jgi:Uma2 family endonuclease
VQHLVLDDISWGFYERLLKEIGDRHLQVTYDQGRLEVMSPLPEHERPSRLLGRLVQTMTFVLNLPIGSWGSTTFRRKDRDRGLQPDECFFLKNESRVRRRKRWDAKKDPPPDLVIEADVTNRSIDREPIYASLGVPELWRWDGKRVQCLHRIGDSYRLAEKSLAFPFLKPSELSKFVLMFDRREENQVVREFTKWLGTISR